MHIVIVESNFAGVQALTTSKELGHRVTFVTSDARRHLYSGHPDIRSLETTIDEFVYVNDTSEIDDVWSAVAKINEKHKIDGILTVIDPCVIPVARAATRLNVPGNSLVSLETARNKAQTRRILAENDIPSTEYRVGRSLSEIKAILRTVQFPVALKPVAGCGKVLTTIARSLDEALSFGDQFFSTVSLENLSPEVRAVGNALLVEDYLQGRMFSAEVGISCGKTVVFAIGERRRAKHNEILEMGTTMPPAVSAETYDEIGKYAVRVIRALGLGLGFFHVEIILTAAGPILLECNPRLMGGSLPLLYNYAFDSNIFEYLINAHLGLPFAQNRSRPGKSCASRMLGAMQPGRVKESFDLTWMSKFQAYDLRLTLNVNPGSHVSKLNSNFDYLGSLRLKAGSPEECVRVTDDVLDHVAATLGISLVE